jgi:plasmid stabilization system protein ParE
MKPVHRHPAVIEDMIRQTAYRRIASGPASADRLIDEMQACLQAISEAPHTGSHRIGQLLEVPALQWKRVGKTKLWFWYVEQAAHIDVIRLVSTDQLPRQALLPEDFH